MIKEFVKGCGPKDPGHIVEILLFKDRGTMAESSFGGKKIVSSKYDEVAIWVIAKKPDTSQYSIHYAIPNKDGGWDSVKKYGIHPHEISREWGAVLA